MLSGASIGLRPYRLKFLLEPRQALVLLFRDDLLSILRYREQPRSSLFYRAHRYVLCFGILMHERRSAQIMATLQIRARRLALEAQVDQLPVKQELVCDAQIHNAERISFTKFVFTAAAVIDAQILGD